MRVVTTCIKPRWMIRSHISVGQSEDAISTLQRRSHAFLLKLPNYNKGRRQDADSHEMQSLPGSTMRKQSKYSLQKKSYNLHILLCLRVSFKDTIVIEQEHCSPMAFPWRMLHCVARTVVLLVPGQREIIWRICCIRCRGKVIFTGFLVRTRSADRRLNVFAK